MPVPSLIAIYFLFFFVSLFVVLPFGIRTTDEAGMDRVPGQADSAPSHFSLGRTALKTAVVALILTVLFYQNYLHGWITRESFNTVLDALGAPKH